MPPMTIGTMTLVGSWLNADEDPATGYVEITPTYPVVSPDDDTTVPVVPVRVYLVNGAISADLLVISEVDPGYTYTLTEHIDGQTFGPGRYTRAYLLSIPADAAGATLDVTDVETSDPPDLPLGATTAALAAALAGVLTTEALAAAVAGLLTTDQLATAIADLVSASDLATAIANLVTTADLAAALADLVTTAALATAISGFVTLTTAGETYITVVDAGTDLSFPRPSGASTVFWRFSNGVDVGLDGINVVNSYIGDLYFVAGVA